MSVEVTLFRHKLSRKPTAKDIIYDKMKEIHANQLHFESITQQQIKKELSELYSERQIERGFQDLLYFGKIVRPIHGQYWLPEFYELSLMVDKPAHLLDIKVLEQEKREIEKKLGRDIEQLERELVLAGKIPTYSKEEYDKKRADG